MLSRQISAATGNVLHCVFSRLAEYLTEWQCRFPDVWSTSRFSS